MKEGLYLCTYFIDMDTLIDLGYWGLFIGSFLASTIIPMSADVLLVGVLTLGGNEWLCLGIGPLRRMACTIHLAALCRRPFCHCPRLLQNQTLYLRPLHANRTFRPVPYMDTFIHQLCRQVHRIYHLTLFKTMQ